VAHQSILFKNMSASHWLQYPHFYLQLPLFIFNDVYVNLMY